MENALNTEHHSDKIKFESPALEMYFTFLHIQLTWYKYNYYCTSN